MKVLILRGLPGSGKSTWAQQQEGTIVSADHFFEQEGEYSHSHERLHDAHIACFRRFLELLQKNEHCIIVDNNNTQPMQITPYVMAAEAYCYDFEVHEFPTSVDTAAERNVHRVPKAVIQRRARAMEEPLPKDWRIVRH